MKIGVIEEVDEQMTMTSMRPETRPHIQSIFPQGPPPPSLPVDVPGMKRNGEILSTSAPAGPGLSTNRYHPRFVFVKSSIMLQAFCFSHENNRVSQQLQLLRCSKVFLSLISHSEAPSTDDYEWKIFRTQLSTHSARSSAAFDPVSGYDGCGTVEEDNVSSRSSVCSTVSSDDDFTRLKLERDKERRDRAMKKFVRSVSGNGRTDEPSSLEMDTETLLNEMAETSKISLQRSDQNSKNESENV